MNKIIKKYTYDEFGMYANGEPVRPIVCLLLGLLRVPISIILLFVGCVFLPGGIILMLAGCFLLERAINILSAVRHYLKARKTFGEFVPKNHPIRNIVIVALAICLFLPSWFVHEQGFKREKSLCRFRHREGKHQNTVETGTYGTGHRVTGTDRTRHINHQATATNGATHTGTNKTADGAANTSTNGTTDRNHQTATTDGTSH